MYQCSKCNVIQEDSYFQLYKNRPSGQCRSCKTASEKARRAREGASVKVFSLVMGNTKGCLTCGTEKPLTDFSPSARGSAGVAAYCKVCNANKARARKGAAQKTTAAYRLRHPERYKANHRIQMFQYRTKKKVTSDGSVTDSFLKELYSEKICFYCKAETEVSARTADHRIPLARGGTHTSGNLVMACATCNSSKRDTPEYEFVKRLSTELKDHP